MELHTFCYPSSFKLTQAEEMLQSNFRIRFPDELKKTIKTFLLVQIYQVHKTLYNYSINFEFCLTLSRQEHDFSVYPLCMNWEEL